MRIILVFLCGVLPAMAADVTAQRQPSQVDDFVQAEYPNLCQFVLGLTEASKMIQKSIEEGEAYPNNKLASTLDECRSNLKKNRALH